MRQPPRGPDFVECMRTAPIPEGCIGIWHLNQMGFAFRSQSVTIYVDPYLSDDLVNATRGRADQHTKIYEPLIRGSDITNADYVFCTHDHLDHLDPSTIREIAGSSPQARFVVPLHAQPAMQRLGIDPGRIAYLRAGEVKELPHISVMALKGAHESFDEDPCRGFAYLSYHITVNGYTVLHAGDTIVHDQLLAEARRMAVDIAILPINGREYAKLAAGIRGNMNCKDAADFGAAIGADIIIPGHWGMHYENTERVGNFADYVFEKYRFQKIRVMMPGDWFVYVK